MCGIAGIFGALTEEQEKNALRPMVTALAHRGPDDEGMFVCRAGDAALGLGHTRLAVLDLSLAGHEQIARYWIVFNGEIYKTTVT